MGAWVETTDVVGGGSKRMFGADAVRATAADEHEFGAKEKVLFGIAGKQ